MGPIDHLGHPRPTLCTLSGHRIGGIDVLAIAQVETPIGGINVSSKTPMLCKRQGRGSADPTPWRHNGGEPSSGPRIGGPELLAKHYFSTAHSRRPSQSPVALAGHRSLSTSCG